MSRFLRLPFFHGPILFPIAVWPWLLTMLVFLIVVTYVPELSLWLPRARGILCVCFFLNEQT